MNATILPELEHVGAPTGQSRFMTVIFNNDVTSFDVVIAAIQAATRCDVEEAYLEAWEAHHFGKAPIHFATREECAYAQAIMLSVGVHATVEPEWSD